MRRTTLSPRLPGLRHRSALTLAAVALGALAFGCELRARDASHVSPGSPPAHGTNERQWDSGQPEAPSAPVATPEDGDEYASDSEAIGDDDEGTDSDATEATERQLPHPFDGLSTAQLADRLKNEPKSLGSASLGRPNSGRLFNAVQLPEDPLWKRVDPSHTWATPETIEYLSKVLHSVAERYPDTQVVSIGHLSAQYGGPLRPHVSHQSGRDVDLGFYYAKQANAWYQRANEQNLDLERTWWLIRSLVLETDIEMILLDQSLSKLVEAFALDAGESREWVESIFHSRNGRPAIVRHAAGHATHLHLRFFNPVAQKSGRRLMPLLVERKIVEPPQQMVTHVVRPGETLAKLAARYSTTMQAIRQANSMKTYQLVAGAAYRIPVRARVLDTPPTAVPRRRVPEKASHKPN